MMTTVTDDCIGCGLCAGSCPAVFQMNAEGRAEVMVPAVPKDLEREVNSAAAACPVSAIEVF